MKAGRSTQAPARVALTSLESLGEEQAQADGVGGKSQQGLALLQNLEHGSFWASLSY